MAKADVKGILGKLRGHVRQAKELAAADAKQRRDAEKHPQSIILGKRDTQGEYDVARELYTTLGGQSRKITTEDLATFRHNMETAQSRFVGAGITARQVLDMAAGHPLKNVDGGDDLALARSQIKMAVPASATNADVRFITDTGPDSKDARHHVLVRFLGFGDVTREMLTTPTNDEKSKAITPKQAANKLRKQRLAFDCDCGRTRYFLRYVATIGGFNAGRAERGYPKIRNPGLKGVACKHVLRVMTEIESSSLVWNFLTKHLEKILLSADNRAHSKHVQADAEAMAAKQSARPRQIKTSEERARQRDAARLKSLVAQSSQPKRVAAATKRAKRMAAAGQVDTILSQFRNLPAEVRAELMAALQKEQTQ